MSGTERPLPDAASRSRLTPGERAPLTRGERTRGILAFHMTLFRRSWIGGVVSRFLTPVLFLAAMGVGVGSLIDRSSGGVAGVPYLRYVVPGLVMASAMQWATSESLYPVMTLVKWNQMYAAMLATPNRVADVIRGHWFMICLGIAWSAAVFVAVAWLFGGVGSWWALLGVPLAVLVALAFVAPLFALAASSETDESFAAVLRLVVTPLMLFSGTFFPVSQLPVWLQPLAWATPLWHGTELARAAFLGAALPRLWWVHLSVLAAYVAGGYVLTRIAFTRRLLP